MTRQRSSDSEELEEGRSIRVLLAEDMDLLRTALVSLLDDEEDIEVIADLKCDQHAVSVALRLRPDVAVISADMPENKGLTTVHELRKRLPECQIVALTVTSSFVAEICAVWFDVTATVLIGNET